MGCSDAGGKRPSGAEATLPRASGFANRAGLEHNSHPNRPAGGHFEVGNLLRVLLIRLSAIGDVVRTLPALTCLRRAFPDAVIDWAVEDASASLLQDQPDLDGVVVFPRRALSRLWLHPDEIGAARRALGEFLRALKEAHYDVVIDFQGTLKSGLMAKMTGAPRRVGLGRGHAREMSHLFYTEPVSLPRRRMNRMERSLALVAHMGASIDNPTASIPARPEDEAFVDIFLSSMGPTGAQPASPTVVFPGTSRTQAYKRYPAERFARAADLVAERTGAPVVVAWGPGEEDLAGEVVGHMRGPATLAPAMTLGQLTALIRRCRVFLSGDTGPMHIAWTVGAPVVAVYGPTDPVVNQPGGQISAVAYRKVSCSPCRNRGCIARTCLYELPPETVADTALGLLDRAGQRRAVDEPPAGGPATRDSGARASRATIGPGWSATGLDT